MEAVPPVNSALPRRSGGGAGVRTFRQTIGNDGTQSYGTKASGSTAIPCAMFAGLQFANHRKRWDAKLIGG